MTHRGPSLSNTAISVAVREEIQRFESVHPSIYAIHDLIEDVDDIILQQRFREHIIQIEDAFVNSQEWTLSRSVTDLKLGVVGTYNSGKPALVHRYLTGNFLNEESYEGGRFKKEVTIEGQSNLLLIREEGGPPDAQFSHWVDAVIFVFSLENEISFNTIYTYFSKMSVYRNNMQDIPILLVGTQDSISENSPRVITDAKARKMATDLKNCTYYEVCSTYGLNVEKVFQEACQKMVQCRTSPVTVAPSSTPQPRSTLTRSYQPQLSHQLSQISITNKINDWSSTSSSNSGVQRQQSSSSPFRETMSSTSGSEYIPPVEKPPDRKKKLDNNLESERFASISTSAIVNGSTDSIKSRPSTELLRSSQLPVVPRRANRPEHDIDGHKKDFSLTPSTTPTPSRKLFSTKNIFKSSSFHASNLLRHGSELSLQIDFRELPSASGNSGHKEKSGKSFVVSCKIRSSGTDSSH